MNVYEDITEVLSSLGMNMVVALGFFLEWKEHKKNKE
jgi:hypothetical protein